MPELRLLTAAQVAKLIRKNPRTVLRMARDGRLPYVEKLSGRTGAYLFDAAVIEYIAQRQITHPTAELAEARAS